MVLEDAKGGSDPLSADELADKLSGCNVRLAVLGACEGGQRDAGNPWGGVIPALVNKVGIPAVIGMQFRIRDRRAIAFVKKLYEVLARGDSIDAAVTAARRVIQDDDRDWAAPVLYLRGEDGVLFPPITRFGELVRRSGEHTRRFLDDVRDGIYHAERYVNRTAAEATLWEFLEGDATGLVLIGKAGCGKTNLLCHWTQALVDGGYPVFIYQCGLSIDSPIEEAIKRELAPAGLGGPNVTLREVVQRVVPEGRKLVLVFDGINESDQGDGPRKVLREIDRIVGELRGHGLRVVLSCYQPTWEWLTAEDDVRLSRGAYLWPNPNGAPLLLDDFTPDELEVALDRYTQALRLPTPLSEVRPSLRRQQSALPVRELRSISPEVREALTLEAPGSPYRRLLDLGVLSRFRREDGTHWLKFASTRFAAIALARQLATEREPVAEQLTTLVRALGASPWHGRWRESSRRRRRSCSRRCGASSRHCWASSPGC